MLGLFHRYMIALSHSALGQYKACVLLIYLGLSCPAWFLQQRQRMSENIRLKHTLTALSRPRADTFTQWLVSMLVVKGPVCALALSCERRFM